MALRMRLGLCWIVTVPVREELKRAGTNLVRRLGKTRGNDLAVVRAAIDHRAGRHVVARVVIRVGAVKRVTPEVVVHDSTLFIL
jgi:hypothetical protein